VSVAETPVGELGGPTSSLLRTLVLSDLVDSTALVERLGDREAAELIRKHDRLARTLADRHGGREIDKTDGFLMMFERPIQAVAFALDYQRGLRQLNAAEQSALSARVGIHVGDVVVWDNSSEDVAKGAKPVEVEGLVKPITSRLMGLALPGQILLSNIAYDLAHRAQGELGDLLESVRWRTHGRYRFRGVPDPVAVFEVGEEGLAPLKAPPWSSKAHREVPFWRRPATVVIEALVVAALIAVPIVMFLRPDPAIAFANRDWVVVGSLHNLTGETVFDDALESALRIGLEQSRYVNVMPDLKVRDTVTRMQRDPDKTEIDRAVGSEVAIRDGAKALILPTIAEIGGRVRITAEVIDPQTQTTVYSETADGIGKESILPSLDTINSRLRVRLGEALATVSKESKPLEKVATNNLDALRAYSLGNNNYVKARFKEAMTLYQQALAMDPAFASASLRVATIHASSGRQVEAEDALRQALSVRERLSARDALYAEVLLSTLRSRADVATKWSALAETYPDYFAGTAGCAYFNWRYANRFDKTTLSLAEAAASTKNPSRQASLHLLGILQAGLGRPEDALRTFADAENEGFVRTEYHAATLASQRKFDQATATLAQSQDATASENAVVRSTRGAFESAFLVDRGLLAEASRHLSASASDIPVDSPLSGLFEAMQLSIAEDPGQAVGRQRLPELRRAVELALKKKQSPGSAGADSLDAQIMLLAYLEAGHRDVEGARAGLAGLGEPSYPEYSANYKLRAIAEAEIKRVAGAPDLAIEQLKKLLDGSELYLTHVALLEAYATTGQSRLALDEARWMVAHRGRAYAEYSPGNLLTSFNVKQANLAMLRAAELALTLGERKEARKMLDAFRNAWPDLKSFPTLAGRASVIQSEVGLEDSP
jgi:putative peptide modification system cyclase